MEDVRLTVWDIISYLLAGPVILAYMGLSRLSFDLAVREIFGHSRLRTKVYDMIQPPRSYLDRLLRWCVRDV